MAWPNDARDKSYSALTSVPASNLNEIQDRVVDLHRDRDITFRGGFAEDTFWELDDVDARFGWDCIATSAGADALEIPFIFRTSVIVSRVRVKFFMNAVTVMTLQVFERDLELAVAATAPSGVAIATQNESGGAPPDWRVHDFAGLSHTIAVDSSLSLLVSNPTVGNRIAGCVVTFQPVTPTP